MNLLKTSLGTALYAIYFGYPNYHFDSGNHH